MTSTLSNAYAPSAKELPGDKVRTRVWSAAIVEFEFSSATRVWRLGLFAGGGL